MVRRTWSLLLQLVADHSGTLLSSHTFPSPGPLLVQVAYLEGDTVLYPLSSLSPWPPEPALSPDSDGHLKTA